MSPNTVIRSGVVIVAAKSGGREICSLATLDAGFRSLSPDTSAQFAYRRSDERTLTEGMMTMLAITDPAAQAISALTTQDG